jgi:hypothetical protein
LTLFISDLFSCTQGGHGDRRGERSTRATCAATHLEQQKHVAILHAQHLVFVHQVLQTTRCGLVVATDALRLLRLHGDDINDDDGDDARAVRRGQTRQQHAPRKNEARVTAARISTSTGDGMKDEHRFTFSCSIVCSSCRMVT